MKRSVAFMVTYTVLLAGCEYARAQSNQEATRALHNLARMTDIAFEIEYYTHVHDGLSLRQGTQEVARAVFAGYEDFLIDPWGTPYRIEADSAHYQIVSAGSDKQFESESVWNEEEVDRPEKDVVMRDGRMIRSSKKWALLTIGAVAVSHMEVNLDASRAKRTAAILEILAIKLDEYAEAHGTYPQTGDINDMARAIGEREVADGWDTPLRYVADPAGHGYKLASAGSDRAFKPESWDSKGKFMDFREDSVRTNLGLTREWDVRGLSEPGGAIADLARAESHFTQLHRDGADSFRPAKTRRSMETIAGHLSKLPWVAYFADFYPYWYTTDALYKLLTESPKYRETTKFMTRADEWNSPFQILIGHESKSFVIVSAGPDRQFFTPDDLFYTDGKFVTAPPKIVEESALATLRPVESANNFKPATVVERVAPSSSQTESFSHRGEISVEVIIDEAGHVRAAYVATPLGPIEDRAAHDAALKWKFTPATVNGKPVATITIVKVAIVPTYTPPPPPPPPPPPHKIRVTKPRAS